MTIVFFALLALAALLTIGTLTALSGRPDTDGGRLLSDARSAVAHGLPIPCAAPQDGVRDSSGRFVPGNPYRVRTESRSVAGKGYTRQVNGVSGATVNRRPSVVTIGNSRYQLCRQCGMGADRPLCSECDEQLRGMRLIHDEQVRGEAAGCEDYQIDDRWSRL